MSDDRPGAAPTLVLPRSIREAIVAEARAGAPEEVCGVLGGTFGDERSRVASRYRTRNAADEPRRRYRIDPVEALETFERLESRGEEIVGFYHSHPRGPPAPSPTDAEAAAWPDRSHVIVSSADETTVRSWRWRAGEERFERERIVVDDERA
ncbi:desampylase [Salinilacihabitans rarus]|uniref:desampylase n=1 Tax=Salinilacihabitans rarus TaxID=2961596 RepID=UPI0020C85428|nr:desampylase [Salinilacihabitans rarus]